jgi:hypothetical protein
MASWHKDQPRQPIASRRAPKEGEYTRLFLATGQPTLTKAQQALLHQSRKLERNLGNTTDLLHQALRTDDPVKCATAVKSLLAIALFLDDYANKASA